MGLKRLTDSDLASTLPQPRTVSQLEARDALSRYTEARQHHALNKILADLDAVPDAALANRVALDRLRAGTDDDAAGNRRGARRPP